MENMKIERRKSLDANAGVIGVELEPYWSQFEGLYDMMWCCSQHSIKEGSPCH